MLLLFQPRNEDRVTDLITRLRTWSHARHAAPASDLMDEAADEIERLRLELSDAGKSNHQEKPDSSTLTAAEREAVERASIAYELLPTVGAKQVSATLRGLLERLK